MTAEVRCDKVPAVRLGCTDASHVIEMALDYARIACCADAVGSMQALIAQTVEFAKTRRQFGAAIGSFQTIQHRLVDMTIAVQESRAIMQAAATAFDMRHDEAGVVVSASSHTALRAGRMVGEQAIQIHGGIGMTSELAAGAYFKRLLANGSLLDDSDWHLDRIAVATELD